MAEWAIVYIGACLLGWALIEKRFASTMVTGPMVFLALGLLAGSKGLGIIELGSGDAGAVIDVVLQVTLALLLFTDAASLHPSSWRKDAALPARLLGIGLPLTIGVGWLIATLLFDGLGIWEAAIIGAIVAPTDAALGKAVISNPRVPERIRTGLDVESGLNDGVSLPFILLFIGFGEDGVDTSAIVATFVEAIGIAVVIGSGVALVAGWLLIRAAAAGWMSPAWHRIAMVAVALIAFAAADQLGGSGFISCFVGGLTFGGLTRSRLATEEVLADDLGSAGVQVSFLLVGAVLVGPALDAATWQVWVMAVLALTVARMGPVALCLIGTGFRPPTVAYLGWFGPRGLATIVFAVLVVNDADLAGTSLIVTVCTITVTLSVYVHGLSAAPGARRYADWYQSHPDQADLNEAEPLSQHPKRARLHDATPIDSPAPKGDQ